MILCVWGLQQKKIAEFFSVNSDLHGLQTVKSKFIPKVPSSPLLLLMSRVPGEIQIGNNLQGTKPHAAKAAHRHVDFRFPSKPHWWVKSITHSGCHENYPGNLFPDQNYSPSSAHSDSIVRWEITLKKRFNCTLFVLAPCWALYVRMVGKVLLSPSPNYLG